MATAKASWGTLLKRETTPASGTYTTIAGLTDVPFPAISSDFSETTDMESSGGFRTHIPTLLSVEEFSVEINYDSADATQEQLTADLVAKTVRNYKIIAVDTGAADWAFAAYVARIQPTGTRDGHHTATVTFRPTGAVTRT